MLKVAVMGLGQRGYGLIRSVLLKIDGVEIVAVCDIWEDRVAEAQKLIAECGGNAKGFTDYKEALNVAGLGACFVFTDWEKHAEIALYAMEKGIPVASEVGCEYSLENCFALVRTQEKTKTPYMFMENCCYGKEEMLATSLVRHGVLGEIVFCEGQYGHDLRHEIAYGLKNRHYRFRNYQNRCCENYPTHELGPIARILNINRGNRIVSVSSVAGKARGLEDYIARQTDLSEEEKTAHFKQGDIIDTMITCAGGETVHLRLDTTLPRFYNRNFNVRGTRGMYLEALNAVYLEDTPVPEWDLSGIIDTLHNNARAYEEKYLPALWKNVTPEMMSAGHGGMDYFVYHAFAEAIINHTPVPIDVYDGVTWMAVSVLSEQSAALGGTPQMMPDFTNGQWFRRKPEDVTEI